LAGFTVSLRTQEEEQQGRRFQAYLNYLECVCLFLAADSSLFGGITNSRQFQDIQVREPSDQARLGAFLRNSWFTEIQFRMPFAFREAMPYSVHWAPVQAYYCIYHLAVSLLLASNTPYSDTHASVLRQIATMVSQRRPLFPIPWGLTCSGDPERPDYRGVPGGIRIAKTNPLTLSHNTSKWDSLGLFLKTTREREFNQRRGDFLRKQKQVRLRHGQREGIVTGLSNETTLFDCLYRLRLRSNYADADSFLMGVWDGSDAVKFYEAIARICEKTMFLLELLTARYIGRARFGGLVGDFVSRAGARGNELIGQRWQAVQQLL